MLRADHHFMTFDECTPQRTGVSKRLGDLEPIGTRAAMP